MLKKRFYLLDLYIIEIIYLIVLFYLNACFNFIVHLMYINQSISAAIVFAFFMLSGILILYSVSKIDCKKISKVHKLKIFGYLSNIVYEFFLGQVFVKGFSVKYKNLVLSFSNIKSLLLANIANIVMVVPFYKIIQKTTAGNN